MKKFLIILGVVIVLALIGEACDSLNPTTTYYIDSNGNGREDWGEGVWYEDNSGTHFF